MRFESLYHCCTIVSLYDLYAQHIRPADSHKVFEKSLIKIYKRMMNKRFDPQKAVAAPYQRKGDSPFVASIAENKHDSVPSSHSRGLGLIEQRQLQQSPRLEIAASAPGSNSVRTAFKTKDCSQKSQHEVIGNDSRRLCAARDSCDCLPQRLPPSVPTLEDDDSQLSSSDGNDLDNELESIPTAYPRRLPQLEKRKLSLRETVSLFETDNH